MRPIISVVMPAFNASRTIGNAVNSIRNQTIKDWELIIVCDGIQEKDEMKKIVRSFYDERISFIERPHEGLVATRNYGNSLAQAEIIAIQDADDVSLPDRLEKCLVWFNHPSELDVVIHGAYRNMWDPQYNAMHREYIPAKNLDLERLKREQYLPGWPIFKKSLWEKYPFRKETEFSYDWMMLLDFCLNGKVKLLDEGLYEYIRMENSASQVFEKDGRRATSFTKIQEILATEYA